MSVGFWRVKPFRPNTLASTILQPVALLEVNADQRAQHRLQTDEGRLLAAANVARCITPLLPCRPCARAAILDHRAWSIAG